VDANYTVINYEGERLIARQRQSFGVKKLGDMDSSKQGLAIYGDKVVRMANVSTSTTHIIYQISSAGVLTQVATFTASTGHSNSLQFAPTLEAGQDFPYLYVANLVKKCSVLSISSAYEVSIVQTITIGASEVANDCNVQIGDDGYIWAVYGTSANKYRFIKFRRVAVSEGDVTLTDADIVDEWTTVESYPYSSYVWQGMKIRNGKIWFVYGQTGSSKKRGIVVYDTVTHAYVTTLDLASINQEFEDMDFWRDSVILATYSSPYYQLQF
jgi:hypothetical protein